MVLCYSGRSKPSALAIAEASGGRIQAVRSSQGDVNWGRRDADTVLNTDISTATNKREMRELFRMYKVPAPRLIGSNETIASQAGTWRLFKPLVGRPDYHMKGRGFWLCRTQDDIDRARRGTRRKAAATHFMEYIADAEHEYRVHIFKGKSIRISEKEFTGQDGNHKEYTTIKPTENIKQVRKAAKQAVMALGLDFGAVDILTRGDDCFVLEVNAAPGLGGSMPKLYADAFMEWSDSEQA